MDNILLMIIKDRPVYSKSILFRLFERNEDNNLNHYFRKKEAEEEQDNFNENDFDQEGSERSLVDNNDNDSDGGLFEGVGDGCIFGFFKLIWKIISFPFKVILRIIEIFD